MKTYVKQSMLVLGLIVSGITLQAQNAKEAIQNTKQIVEGKKMLERDIKELEKFKAKIALFNTAFDAKNSEETNTLKKNLVSDMIREVEQSGVKAKQARREIAQSSAEVRSDRRENRDNREDSKRGRFDRRDDKRDMARDRANTRDDMRDRRDDMRDFEMQIERAETQANILKKLKAYNFSFKGSDYDASLVNKKLISDFIVTMKQDIEATKRELAEDNRERKEDRRERVDDRNERNERDSKRKRKW
jgi:hypothetical protein